MANGSALGDLQCPAAPSSAEQRQPDAGAAAAAVTAVSVGQAGARGQPWPQHARKELLQEARVAREVAIPAMLRRRQCLGHSTACGKDHGFNRMRQTNSEHALSKDAAMQPQTPELLNVLVVGAEPRRRRRRRRRPARRACCDLCSFWRPSRLPPGLSAGSQALL